MQRGYFGVMVGFEVGRRIRWDYQANDEGEIAEGQSQVRRTEVLSRCVSCGEEGALPTAQVGCPGLVPTRLGGAPSMSARSRSVATTRRGVSSFESV